MTPELPDMPTFGGGALGYAIATVVVGWSTVKKYLSEQRGESKELTRLATALSEERAARIAAEQAREHAWMELNKIVREVGELKAQIRGLETQIRFMQNNPNVPLPSQQEHSDE